ncbi:MAG: zinc ribbon domain-containing protein [Planctomycetales bacterium]
MDQSPGAAVAVIHHLHLQLREVQDQMDRGPKLLKVRQEATGQRLADLETLKQKHKALRMAADQKSLQLKSNEAKISDLRVKLNQAASNREFDIIRGQIDADTMANSVLEDEILDTLEKVDAAQRAIHEMEQAVTAAKAEEARLAAETKTTLPDLEARSAELQRLLATAEAAIPPDFLGSYRRLSQAYGAGALAEVDGNVCGSCYVSLPPQSAVQIRAGQVMFCKTCGRLMYARQG